MGCFWPLLELGLKRRGRDFFVVFYSIVFPLILILLLGYLSSMGYGAEFTGYHYYSIVVIPFCSFMAVSTVSYATQDEKMHKTAYRFFTAPIKEREIILSKYFACGIILSVCNVITLLLVKLLFGLEFQGKLGSVLLLLTAETFMISGIGVFMELAFKNLDMIRNFTNIPICIFGFLGGSFFPVGSLNPFLIL